MMNDRFSVELRKHLLSTANERPADGQLAALVERVAVTPQRRSLVAQLTWNPGRIGPFPSRAIRYGLIAVALALAAVVGAILAAGLKSGPSTVFEGTWIAIDPADGSGMTLVVGPGKAPAVYFEDGYASGDACVNDVVKRFTARGTGTIDGNRLDVEWPEGGGCGLMTVPMGDGSYAYDEQTDTLVDGQELTWGRALGGDRPATRAPGTQAPATDVPASAPPSLRPGCMQFDGGGTYTAPVGKLSLTVTVPTAAETRWHGLRDSFYLERAPCGSGGFARLQASLVSQVYADSCHRAGTGVEVKTATEAEEALAAQTGYEVVLSDLDTTVEGYPARRLFISIEIDFDATTCDDGVLALWRGAGASTDPGWNTSFFLVDVEGSVLALSASRLTGDEEEVPLVTELASMVDSLRIEP